MDKFDQVMQEMARMTKEEVKRKIDSLKPICICPNCSSYTDWARDKKELLYCGLGKSPSCITSEASCLCPGCPVTEEIGLRYNYFCTRKSEKEQRGS